MSAAKSPSQPAKSRTACQLNLFAEPEHPLLDELRGMNLDELTPLAALHALKGKLKK